jgi:hypothetical protein
MDGRCVPQSRPPLSADGCYCERLSNRCTITLIDEEGCAMSTMTYRPKWGSFGGWLDDSAWKDLLGDNGPFDSKVLATISWAATDHADEQWGNNELSDHCTYELDSSSEEFHAALQRLVDRKAITPAILLEYDDERVVLEDVLASVQEFLLSRETELVLVRAVGLHQANSDHVALLNIFDIKRPGVSARFGPEQDPQHALSDEFLDAADSSPNVTVHSTPRAFSREELDDVVSYWASLPRGSDYHDEASLLRFLKVFTPSQIKKAMQIAKSKRHPSYFRYLCGILHNWKREFDAGEVPTSLRT